MRLDQDTLQQLQSIFASLKHRYTLRAKAPEGNHYGELEQLLGDFASTSPQISLEMGVGDKLSVEILRDDQPTGITFRAIPSGHEFSSLILAIYNADGQGKNLPDAAICDKIRSLRKPIHLRSYISLSCTNCPDVVQSLNLITLIAGEGVTHEMVDGALYTEEAKELNISAVPTVYLGDQVLHIGKSSLGELLGKLADAVGVEPSSVTAARKEYDQIVIGGGPAGAAAALYSARKGLHVALVADRMGGQVNETTAIENVPSVLHTTGTQLAEDLRQHVLHYHVEILEQRHVEQIKLVDTQKEVVTSLGETLVAPQVIIATGASWRKLGVPGEAEHIGRGVAFCPHCDGPFFKGQDIAVVGGGNSGIEAAIDLAGICKHVTVLEFMESLKADTVLQEQLAKLPNVTVHTNVATEEVIGNGNKVSALRIAPRDGSAPFELAVAGVFVQIGLKANTDVFDGLVERNRMGEIVIDDHCRSSVAGIYAAGDCASIPYKQVVIAMGEGAKAALTAFDDRIRTQG